MNIDKIQDDLEQLMTAGIVKSHENLKDHVYTKMGGKADILAAPATYDEIQKIVTYAEQNGITLTVLGNGSNVIIRDGGVRGIVLQTAGLTEMGIRDNLLYAQCGAKIIDVSRYALDKELTGLEFACGIPGTVGGALYMNAGAYGGEIKDVLHSALAINKNGQMVTLQGDELQWGYRKVCSQAVSTLYLRPNLL